MKSCIFLSGAAALCFCYPAYSQVTPPAGTSVSPEADKALEQTGSTEASSVDDGLGDIVVTAQKRSERLQQTPLAVSAVTSDTIRSRGIDSVAGLTSVAPSVSVSVGASSATNVSLFIRGIGEIEQVLTSDSPVGLYVDGIVVGRSAGAAFEILDLERIEVLRGPQGTLYGRNTIGGAVNFITAKPSDDFGVTAQASIGNYNLAKGGFTLNTGDFGGSGLKGLISFVHKQRSGYVNNPLEPDDRDPGAYNLDAVRAALRYESDALTIDYGFDFSVRQSIAGAFQLTAVRPDVLDYLNASPGLGGSAPVVSGSRLDQLALAPVGRIRDEVEGHTLTVNIELGDVTIRSLTGYRRWHGLNQLDTLGGNAGLVGFTVSPAILAPPNPFIPLGVGPINLFTAKNDRKQHQWSQEFNVLGNIGDRFKYVVGLYYFDEKARETNPTNFLLVLPSPVPIPITPDVTLNGFGVPLAGLLAYQHESESRAAFAQASYSLTDRLSLTGGIRYTEDEKHLTQTSPYVRSPDASFSKTNFAVSLDFQATPDLLAYGRVSTGYKSGGFNARSANSSFDPESLTSYEAGIKSEWFDRRLRMNLTGFYADHKDVQLQQTQAGTGGAQTATVNAGKARYWGVEAEVAAKPTPELTLAANVGYVNRKYKQFLILDPVTDTFVDVKDSAHFVVGPTTTISALAQYEFPPMSVGQVVARVDYDYRGKIYFNPTTVGAPFNDEIRGDGRNLVGLRLALRDVKLAGGSAEIAAWGKNVFNEKYREFGIDFGALGYAGNIYAEPATYGLDFTLKF
ncbi:TonB-dependent receptor [Sphingomonas sp. DBB INV C78]|uniref:TonB-dependent receptor n=1 Tax=Sphingomonas sp. DBB INV C78 TaxID=3349434 RepID=UPI0036D32A2B